MQFVTKMDTMIYVHHKGHFWLPDTTSKFAIKTKQKNNRGGGGGNVNGQGRSDIPMGGYKVVSYGGWDGWKLVGVNGG